MRDHVKPYRSDPCRALGRRRRRSARSFARRFSGYLEASNQELPIATSCSCARRSGRSSEKACLFHDSQYRVLAGQPFPSGGYDCRQDRHVGQNASVQRTTGRRPADHAGSIRHYLRHGASISSSRSRPGRTGTAYLTKLLRANCPGLAECHHERTGFDRMGVQNPDASTFMLFNSQRQRGRRQGVLAPQIRIDPRRRTAIRVISKSRIS